MSFSSDKEKNGKMSFLDVEVSRENGRFKTAVYRKPTFSGVYTHFECFLLSSNKFGMIYTLVYRCFTLCSAWREFYRELVTLVKEILQRNRYLTSFRDKCFKTFLHRLHIKPTLATVKRSLYA